MTQPLVVMGGAFDPVHVGHLRTALEVWELLHPAEVRLIPSANPPHRPPHHASGADRKRWLEEAVRDLPWCSVDDRELRRDGPSWTVLTLQGLRQEFPDRCLCMILGMDAFLGLADWHCWQEIPELAHIIVVHRPGWLPPETGVAGQLLRDLRVDNIDALRGRPAGNIYIQEVTQLEISSTSVRAVIEAGGDPRFMVPDGVARLLTESGQYAARSG